VVKGKGVVGRHDDHPVHQCRCKGARVGRISGSNAPRGGLNEKGARREEGELVKSLFGEPQGERKGSG